MSASPTYEITANLPSLGLTLGSKIEAITPNFYDDGNLVLARKTGCVIVGILRRVGSRLRVDVPEHDDQTARSFYIERGDLIGIAVPATAPTRHQAARRPLVPALSTSANKMSYKSNF